jgi:SAM-dependent methyltransferase
MAIIKADRNELINVVKAKLVKADTILDIGCGIRPQNYIQPKVHICCDPHLEYLDHIKKTVEYYRYNVQEDFTPNEYCTITEENKSEFVFINADWSDALKLFPEQSVDTIFLLDIIEHLNKEKGLHLIKETEKLCKKQIVLFTPLGFIEQEHETEKDAWGFNGAHLQKHLSGWLPEDLGDEWEFFVCEDFHVNDNVGVNYEKPKGAFFAIKNFSLYQPIQKNLNYSTDEFAEAFSKLGEFILTYDNDLEEAHKYFKKAVELKPDYAHAINNLGVIAWNKNDGNQAIEYIKKSYEIDKSNRVFVANYVDLLLSLERKDEALDIITKYLEYHASDDEMKVKYFNLTGQNWEENQIAKTSNLEYWKAMQDDNYFENHMYYGNGSDKLPLFGDDLELIKSFLELNDNMNVAIIGCGYGRESVFIGPYVKHIYGIDVTKKILDKAVKFVNKNGVFNFTPILAESWKYDIKEKIDLVFELTVFQHLTRDLTEDYISGLAAKLSEDGKMLLQFMDCDYGTREAELKKYEPCVNWKMEEIEQLAAANKLKILKVEHKHWPQDKAYWHWVLLGRNN